MKSKRRKPKVLKSKIDLPDELTQMPFGSLPNIDNERRIAVWASKDFLVQVFDQGQGIIRLSINRTLRTTDGQWLEGITWDDLQMIKNTVGYADRDAVEVYPNEKDVINIANIRHLWVLPEPLSYIWRNKCKK